MIAENGAHSVRGAEIGQQHLGHEVDVAVEGDEVATQKDEVRLESHRLPDALAIEAATDEVCDVGVGEERDAVANERRWEPIDVDLVTRNLPTLRYNEGRSTRSMIGAIALSGNRIVPSVCAVLTVPWSSDPPVTNFPRKRARFV